MGSRAICMEKRPSLTGVNENGHAREQGSTVKWARNLEAAVLLMISWWLIKRLVAWHMWYVVRGGMV